MSMKRFPFSTAVVALVTVVVVAGCDDGTDCTSDLDCGGYVCILDPGAATGVCGTTCNDGCASGFECILNATTEREFCGLSEVLDAGGVDQDSGGNVQPGADAGMSPDAGSDAAEDAGPEPEECIAADCFPFVCNTDGDGCIDACERDSDCTNGFFCDAESGDCVDSGAVSCEADGFDGVCIDVDDCTGVSTPGLCPGAANIQCCTTPVLCSVDGVDGVCIDVERCDDGRISTPGLCPGAANIQCCTDPVVDACAAGEFACGDGRCISAGAVCDFVNDCGDFGDERGCETLFGDACTANEVACVEACVSVSLTCDGTSDCEDGFDESGCR